MNTSKTEKAQKCLRFDVPSSPPLSLAKRDAEVDAAEVSMEATNDSSTTSYFPPTPGQAVSHRDGRSAPSPCSPSRSMSFDEEEEGMSMTPGNETSSSIDSAYRDQNKYGWHQSASDNYLYSFSSSPPPKDPAGIASIINTANMMTCSVCGQPVEACGGLTSHVDDCDDDDDSDVESVQEMTDKDVTDKQGAIPLMNHQDSLDRESVSSDDFDQLEQLHLDDEEHHLSCEYYLQPDPPPASFFDQDVEDLPWKQYIPQCKQGFSGERRWCAPLKAYWYDACQDGDCESCMSGFFMGSTDAGHLLSDDLQLVVGEIDTLNDPPKPPTSFMQRVQEANEKRILSVKNVNCDVKATSPSNVQYKPLKPRPPLRQKYSIDFEGTSRRAITHADGLRQSSRVSRPPRLGTPGPRKSNVHFAMASSVAKIR